MYSTKRSIGLIAVAAADIAALLSRAPHWTALAHDLAAPHEWVARAGADRAAISLGAAALWCLALWLAAGLCAAAAAALPGRAGFGARRAAGWLLPKVLLRAVAGAAGLGVLLAPVAAGAEAPPGGPVAAQSVPSRPTDSQQSVPSWSTDSQQSVPSWSTDTQQSVPSWPTDTEKVPQIQIGWPKAGPRPAPPSMSDHPPPPGGATEAPDHTTPVPPTPSRDQSPPAADPSERAHEHVQPGPDPADRARGKAVRVQPGDSLWLIAARRLGPDASDADTAAVWPRWYAANRHLIGGDPSLLRPGQLLHAPTESP